MRRVLRLGTRGSPLAVIQSQWVADRIRSASGLDVALVRITTTGDVTEGSLASLGGTGVFATALREALVGGECDVVVHSLKDLPTARFPGLEIAAIPLRERPHDSLCSVSGAGLHALPPGVRVGTGSPRRAAQVLRARPDLRVLDIRGNVDTRLAKMRAGDYGAIVLAAAGLRRLGRVTEIVQEFPLETWPTSAGQGALAIECRSGVADAELRTLLASLTDGTSLMTSTLEREVLRQLEAGCSAPVGISASVDGPAVSLLVEVYGAHSRDVIRVERLLEGRDPGEASTRVEIATAVVAELIDRGAAEIAAVGPGG